MSNLLYVNTYAVSNSDLPLPPPKCLFMYQFCHANPENYFVTISTVYLSNLHNKNIPRLLVVSPIYPIHTVYPIHIPIMYALGAKNNIYNLLHTL